LGSLDVFGDNVLRDGLHKDFDDNGTIGAAGPDGLEEATGTERTFIAEVREFWKGTIDSSLSNVPVVEGLRVGLPHGGGCFGEPSGGVLGMRFSEGEVRSIENVVDGDRRRW
jgi:hypothetical protein